MPQDTRRITIVHPNSGQKTVVEAPAGVSMERLVPALVGRLNMPSVDQRGQPIEYRLTSRRDGQDRQLNQDETLAAAAVQDDDVLHLSADMRAGARLP